MSRGFGDQDPDPVALDSTVPYPRHPGSGCATATGDALVGAVSDAIGRLEGQGHFGPFAVVLDQQLFLVAQTPNVASLYCRKIASSRFWAAVRCSARPRLTQTAAWLWRLAASQSSSSSQRMCRSSSCRSPAEPNFLFRVWEKIALRIKEVDAIVRLEL